MKAAVITTHNPWHPHRDRSVRVVERRHTLGRLAPRTTQPFICVHNGEAVLRKDWGRRVADGDVVVFAALPRGGGSNPLRIVLSIAVMAFAAWAAPAVLGAVGMSEVAMTTFIGGLSITPLQLATAAIGLVGNMLISALLPAPTVGSTGAMQLMGGLPSPSPTYSLQAQGNSARLENPIPVQYGRMRFYPDFASLPFVEYYGNEQYLYQLFCLGVGEFAIEKIQIEDSPISSFFGVSYQVVQPNQQMTLFPANVTSSDEVAGQDLTGTVSGPFAANAAGTYATAIGVDLAAPRGLYYVTDKNDIASLTWRAKVEAREIDDDGVAIGSWVTLGEPTASGATTTPQRYSFKYTVNPGRYQVRVSRLDTEQTGTKYAHDLIWAGLRAYLKSSRTFGDVTLLAVRMQATSQLSAQAARKINVIATRKLQDWTPGSGWSGTTTATSSIALALMDAATASYGANLDDDRVDLASITVLGDIWAARGDEFNGRFDTATTCWEALSSIAKVGRAKPYMQGGILRIMRDGPETVPVALYSMRNIIRGSFGIEYLTPTDTMADCVDVTYWDEDFWTLRRVRAALTGSPETKPAKLPLFGVTDRNHAYREGLYYAACNLYRRRLIKFGTEMEGFLPALGDLIAIQHDMPAWGQHAEIVAASANLLLRSEEMDNAAWTKTNLTTAGMANVAVAPDGGTTAEQLVASAANGSATQAVTAASAGYVFSVYLKRKTGIGAVQLTLDGSAWTTVAVTADWLRFELAGTLANPTVGVRLATSGDAVYAWGAQLEVGSVAGPYAPAAAAPVTVLALTEPLTWQSGQTHYFALRSRLGRVLGPYEAIRCRLHDDAVATADMLDEAPYTGLAAERTHLVFGWAETWRQEARVLAIRPRGLTEVEIEAITEDPSVHTADQGMTAPAVQTSQLPTVYAMPVVLGLTAYSDPTDVSIMLLSWQPAPGADHYLIEVSHADDQENWQRIGEVGANNYTAKAIYGAATIIRVAAVGLTIGPWVMIGYAQFADYMWNANDATLMWNADDSTEMWAY